MHCCFYLKVALLSTYRVICTQKQCIAYQQQATRRLAKGDNSCRVVLNCRQLTSSHLGNHSTQNMRCY
jgi:hypothetical protein